MMKRGAIILRRAQTSNLRRPFSFKPARAFSGATVSGDANVEVARKESARDLFKDETPGLGGWKKVALGATGFYGKQSTLIRQSNRMFETCIQRSKSPELQKALGLDDSFSSMYTLLTLHVWMCLAKLRSSGPDGKQLSQSLFDNFWDEMVIEIRAKGVTELHITKNLVELQEIFFGSALAYDEGIASSDAVIGAALWRNLYGYEVNAEQVEVAVQYVRQETTTIEKMADEYFMQGYFEFSDVTRMKRLR